MQIQTVFRIVVITYIITYLGHTSGSEECIHDSLQKSSISSQWIDYNDISKSKRLKRDVSTNLYSPIRIFTFYSELEVELVQKDVAKLKLLVDQAVQYTSGILSVIPVQGLLLLKRTTGCLKYWVKGQNIGKCSTLDRQYKGEFCHDNLKIRRYKNRKVISDTGLYCSQRSYDSLFKEVSGVQRLATPVVIEKMREHFNCSEEDYGGPIKFQNGKETSHWEEKFMYGSIMTAKLGEPHLTVVDPITLAVLEDSGWYKVDYTKAGRFFWGKDEGCMFGLPDTCLNDSQYFCTNQTVTGCHYLHKDKAVCDVTDTGDECKVLQPKPQGECFQQPQDGNNKDDTEIFTKSSRCFWSNLTRVPEYQGVIKCPDNKDIICPLISTVTTSTPVVTTTTVKGVPLKINIIFKKMVLNADTITKEEFQKQIRQKILNITMVDSDRLKNVMIDRKEGVVMFDLITSGDQEEDKTYQSLYNAVVNELKIKLPQILSSIIQFLHTGLQLVEYYMLP
ncbi:hypothetical protein KUTeg_013837 [Tegillarca granosa]|uniref:Leishmanolysin-like peptidase n=1 Tax=Tegillarca granosa TaxID=220873 RepID=A0ABQ9EUV0_TEGGR|nr:hypothetical protein KUTeg_013837 [Tegillarca granosa]